MKGWAKIIVVFIVIALIAAAAYYVVRNTRTAPPITPEGSDPNVVRVNASATSVYLGQLSPEPSLSSVTFRVYAPGLGHVDRQLSPSPQVGVLTSEALFQNVVLEYHDLDNDTAAGNGDYFTIRALNGTLLTGIWHTELLYESHASGKNAFHFHVLPPGVSSIAENTEVDFIDVGQGDAELITTSDGKHILIDTGPNGAEASLLSYLRGKGISVIDALIISHPDADHVGGAKEVLEAMEVRSVYHPGLEKDTVTFYGFINATRAEGCPVHTSFDVHAGDYLDLSVSEDFRVLSINASTEANDASIVLRMDAPSRSFLFTGDIGFDVENGLIAHFGSELDVDVLKVAHHGSRTSSSQAFLEAVTPIIAVIEVGENTYGHPTDAALSRLAAVNATVVRTDMVGNYPVTSSGAIVQ